MIAAEPRETVVPCTVAFLRPHPDNPRGLVSEADVQDLAASIREQGVIEPLVVTTSGIVLAGHRRLVAARLAGLEEVPIVLRDVDERAALALMLAENVARQDLSPLQEARAFARLIAMGMTQSEVGRQVGVPQALVQRRLVLLKLAPEVQEAFDRRELPVTLAPALARVPDWTKQRRFAHLAQTRKLTASQIEDLVDRDRRTGPVANGAASKVAPATSTVAAVGADRPSAPQTAANGRRWPSRGEAIALLKASPKKTLTYADLLAAFQSSCSTCDECGLADLQTACRECPGPAMVKRIVEAAERRR